MDDKVRQLVMDYKQTFGTEHGARVLDDLKAKSTFARSAIPLGQPIDTSRILCDEAQRSVILYITHKVEMPLGEKPETTAVNEGTI